jgi:hypothetical protein
MVIYGTGIFKYYAQEVDELSIEVEERLELLHLNEDSWWLAKVGDKIGLVPSNYVRVTNGKLQI